jgi:hypothetical protein
LKRQPRRLTIPNARLARPWCASCQPPHAHPLGCGVAGLVGELIDLSGFGAKLVCLTHGVTIPDTSNYVTPRDEDRSMRTNAPRTCSGIFGTLAGRANLGTSLPVQGCPRNGGRSMTTSRKPCVYAARNTIIRKTVLGLIAATGIGSLCLTGAQAQTGGHGGGAAGSSASPSSSAPSPTVNVPAQPGPTTNPSGSNTVGQSPEAPVSPSTPGAGSSVYGSGSGSGTR